MWKVLLTAGVLTVLAAGCTVEQPGVALSAPDFFGPEAFRGLAVGMSKQEALGTGRLGKAPTSKLHGCEDYSFTGGPKPDPAQMSDEQAAERKSNEVKSRLDAANVAHKPLADNPTLDELRKSADELVVIAEIMKESVEADRQLSLRSSARNVKFLAAGGVSFDAVGRLRLVAAPPGAKTPAGIGAGSSSGDVRKAHPEAKLVESGDYEMPVPGKPDQLVVFRMAKEGKVSTLMLRSVSGC